MHTLLGRTSYSEESKGDQGQRTIAEAAQRSQVPPARQGSTAWLHVQDQLEDRAQAYIKTWSLMRRSSAPVPEALNHRKRQE